MTDTLIPAEFKTISDTGEIEGYASTFGNRDLVGDIVGGIVPASELVTDALVKAMTQEDAKGTARPRKPAVGIGKGS